MWHSGKDSSIFRGVCQRQGSSPHWKLPGLHEQGSANGVTLMELRAMAGTEDDSWVLKSASRELMMQTMYEDRGTVL